MNTKVINEERKQSMALICYINSKPLWEIQTINNFKENTNIEPLLYYMTKENDLLIASDGSWTVTNSGGGWVIETEVGTNIIRKYNLEFGQIQLIQSYRREVYDSLTSQLFIQMYA